MSYEADEQYTLYNEHETVARKSHRCDACQETILPGHTYMRVSIVFDGCAETVKRCARCQAIHLHLRQLCAKEKYCDMWPSEKLDCGETYKGHWEQDPPEDIAALAFALPKDFEL